tara:strand:- start:350 stop:922 length:573 start_codon:yes stop_codon:yes gene_type:complete
MTSILKADTIQDADGNNIINESGNTITIGASGDTVIVPSGATLNVAGTLQSGGSALVTGKVLQVVAGTDNTQRSASSSNMSHGNSTAIATLTPSATSSKILVIANTTVGKASGTGNYSIFRDNTTNLATNYMLRSDGDNSGLMFSAAVLDSPNTTSEINYRIKWNNSSSAATYIGYDSSFTSVVAIEIGA